MKVMEKRGTKGGCGIYAVVLPSRDIDGIWALYTMAMWCTMETREEWKTIETNNPLCKRQQTATLGTIRSFIIF